MIWPLRTLLESLDSKELGEAEWWRRMATLQNAAARSGDGFLLEVLDDKKESRWGTGFDAPEIITQNNLPPRPELDNIIRWFQELAEEKRQEVIKKAISLLFDTYNNRGTKKLFNRKQHWMAVYMVLRDRLGLIINQNKFHTYIAKLIPDNCPSNLMITSYTMTNFSRTISCESLYFKMTPKQNPFHEHCDKFWTIIKGLYYSREFTNK